MKTKTARHTPEPKNQKLLGQTCDCFFIGAAMLCKLHAAAPDLLEALKDVLLDIETPGLNRPADMTVSAIRTAIAKAEGR